MAAPLSSASGTTTTVARLSDPVRYEPGHPADPVELRFPHLYGALR
ncbi:hypothetical protein [Geodermatophilus ruber]|nr:hypothetical protein [Geodermatophilus ruber]